MKINIISVLAVISCLTPVMAKEPTRTEAPVTAASALPKSWDNDTRAMYDLLLAQLQSSSADYAASVDTLVKFAKTQKDDALYAKAYKALLRNKRYNDASLLAKDWQQQSKHSIGKFYALALALNGDTEQAINEIQRAITNAKINPSDNDALESLIYPHLQLLLSHWYQPNATAVLARLHEEYPTSEAIAIMYAKQLRWQGHIEKAINIIDKRRFNDPRNLELIQEKSDTYRYAMRLKDADKVWQNLLTDYPNEPTFQFAYAQFLYDRYDFSGADKQLQNLVDKTLETPINTLKIMTAIQLGKYTDAEAIFNQYFKYSEDKQGARYHLANNLLQQKQYDLAKTYFEPLIDLDSDNNENIDDELALLAGFKMVQILYAKAPDNTDMSAGDAWFKRLSAHFRLSEVEALQQQANALEKAGYKQLALSRLKDFLDKNPNNEAIRYTRGLIAADMRLNTLAIEDLKRLYAASPDNLDVQNALGYTLLSNDEDLDEGAELIAKALFSKPFSPAIIDSMGWVYYRRDQFDAALPFFRFAYAAYLDGEIIGHYILALYHAGKPDMAKRLYQLESRYFPNAEKIQRVVAPILPKLTS